MEGTRGFDGREEGLKALASMIAEAYLKGKTFHNDENPLVSEDEIIVGSEPYGEKSFRYTETVSVEALLRRRKRVGG